MNRTASPPDPTLPAAAAAAALASLPVTVLVTDADPIDEPGPRIVWANTSAGGLCGYEPESLIGRNPRFLQGPRTERRTLDRIRSALTRREPVDAVVMNYRSNGAPYWVEMRIEPFVTAEGRQLFVSAQRDVSPRLSMEHIAQRSNSDEAADAAASLGAAAAAERRILATTLHDQALQLLLASTMELETLAAGDHVDEAAGIAAGVVENLNAAVRAIRHVQGALYPLTATWALQGALDELASRVEADSGLRMAATVDQNPAAPVVHAVYDWVLDMAMALAAAVPSADVTLSVEGTGGGAIVTVGVADADDHLDAVQALRRAVEAGDRRAALLGATLQLHGGPQSMEIIAHFAAQGVSAAGP